MTLPMSASAHQHVIYPHAPTPDEQETLHDMLSQSNSLEEAFDPDSDYKKLKPGMKIVVAKLDQDKEFIVFSPPKELCGNLGCVVDIWKKSGEK